MSLKKSAYSLKTIILAFIHLSLLLQVSAFGPKRRFYAEFASDLELLTNFEVEIARYLTHALLTARSVPLGSEIRVLIELYLRDFYETSGYTEIKDLFDSKGIQASKNPICAYRVIRRVKNLLRDIIPNKDFRLKFGNLYRRIMVFFWKNGWLVPADVEFTIDAILRLQQVYDFDIQKFANGRISATYGTSCKLKSIHCYDISTVASKREQFASAIEWLELAKEKALSDNLTSIPLIEFFLKNSIDKHNLYFEEDLIMELEPTFFNRKIRHIPQDSKMARKIRGIQYDAFKGNRRKHYQDINYLALCSGENFQSEIEKSHLFCWYEFKIHPSFTIGPVKMEFWARNPDVVQMYDVLHEKEIRSLVAETSRLMTASKFLGKNRKPVRGKQSPEVHDTKVRSSVNAWYTGPEARNLSLKIERLTGLYAEKLSAAADLQVACYSSGGHNSPHSDSDGTRADWASGPRIATFMFYFNDVEEGGGTAFTSLGVAVKPVKGSALFWHNVYTDGDTDWDAIHGACPVLLGEKWVANKWIHIHDQFLIRKCGLKRNERFHVPVNNKYPPTPQID